MRRHDAVVVVRRQQHGGRVLEAVVVAGGALLFPRPPHIVQRGVLDEPLKFFLVLRAPEITSPCTTYGELVEPKHVHDTHMSKSAPEKPRPLQPQNKTISAHFVSISRVSKETAASTLHKSIMTDLVDAGGHQEPTIAAALDAQPARARVPGGHEELAGGDEIVEAVLLLLQRAGLVPVFAVLPAAPDVGDARDEPKVPHEDDSGGAELRRHVHAEPAVAEEQGWV